MVPSISCSPPACFCPNHRLRRLQHCPECVWTWLTCMYGVWISLNPPSMGVASPRGDGQTVDMRLHSREGAPGEQSLGGRLMDVYVEFFATRDKRSFGGRNKCQEVFSAPHLRSAFSYSSVHFVDLGSSRNRLGDQGGDYQLRDGNMVVQERKSSQVGLNDNISSGLSTLTLGSSMHAYHRFSLYHCNPTCPIGFYQGLGRVTACSHGECGQ
jgi:hypothetical protein